MAPDPEDHEEGERPKRIARSRSKSAFGALEIGFISFKEALTRRSRQRTTLSRRAIDALRCAEFGQGAEESKKLKIERPGASL
jgi:hypothetical protein